MTSVSQRRFAPLAAVLIVSVFHEAVSIPRSLPHRAVPVLA